MNGRRRYYGHEPIGSSLKFCVVVGLILGGILAAVVVFG